MHNVKKMFQPPKESEGVACCNKHGDYKTTMIDFPGEKAPMPGPCPHCSVVQLDQQRELKTRQKMHALDHLLERSGIPKRFRNKSLDDYQPANDSQIKSLAVAKKYAENFDERLKAGGCLAFTGHSGVGKSHIACGIANSVIEKGFTALFVPVIEAVRAVKSTYSSKSKHTESQVIHRFTWPDLLILDEVGVQYGSDSEFLILTELINLRYMEMKPTIMISNLKLVDFEKLVGDRVVDRLYENGGMMLNINGDSYRRKNNENS